MLFDTGSPFNSFYQFNSTKSGYLQITGKIRKDNKPESGVSIQIVAPGAASQTVASKDNGNFTFNLDLQKNYSIKFMKNGLVTRLLNSIQLSPVINWILFFRKNLILISSQI